MKNADPKSNVFTVAGKDRAAVYLGGKNPDLAIYYNYSGSFITSDYYADKLPDWLIDFNQTLNFSSYRDSVWDHIAPTDYYQKMVLLTILMVKTIYLTTNHIRRRYRLV